MPRSRAKPGFANRPRLPNSLRDDVLTLRTCSSVNERWPRTTFAKRVKLLDRQRPREGEEDLRGWEWRYLWRRSQSGDLFELGPHAYEVENAVYAEGGKTIVAFEAGGRVDTWDVSSRKEVALLQQPVNPGGVRVSSGILAVTSDGEWVAAAGRNSTGDNVIRIWDVVQKTLISELPLGEHRASYLAFSPDKRSLAAYLGVEDSVGVWDPATRTQTKRLLAPS